MCQNCPICLEKLNGNIQNFCCQTYHKRCLVELIKKNKKCSICRFDYKIYAKYIEDNDTNLHKAICRSIIDLNDRFDLLLMEFRNKTIDLIARTTYNENMLRNINVSNTANNIINNHSMRIGDIERKLNDLTK